MSMAPAVWEALCPAVRATVAVSCCSLAHSWAKKMPHFAVTVARGGTGAGKASAPNLHKGVGLLETISLRIGLTPQLATSCFPCRDQVSATSMAAQSRTSGLSCTNNLVHHVRQHALGMPACLLHAKPICHRQPIHVLEVGHQHQLPPAQGTRDAWRESKSGFTMRRVRQ